MTIRQAVQDFVDLGPLPPSSALPEVVEKHEICLSRIKHPITNGEAQLLVKCFGPDDCFGLAWALLHLIETAPGGIPIKTKPDESENEWVRFLWDRSHRVL
jgi:hypothetical protein